MLQRRRPLQRGRCCVNRRIQSAHPRCAHARTATAVMLHAGAVRWGYPQHGGQHDVVQKHVVEMQAAKAGQRCHERRQRCGVRCRAAAQAQALQVLQGRYGLQVRRSGLRTWICRSTRLLG